MDKVNKDFAVKDKTVWDYFVECITTKCSCFKGRARRKEYWGFVLFYSLIWLALGGILSYGENTDGFDCMDISNILVFLVLLLPNLGVTVRRLHDVGFSGWWLLLEIPADVFIFVSDKDVENLMNTFETLWGLIIFVFIPAVFILVLTLLKSNPQPNKYGPVPEGVKVD